MLIQFESVFGINFTMEQGYGKMRAELGEPQSQDEQLSDSGESSLYSTTPSGLMEMMSESVSQSEAAASGSMMPTTATVLRSRRALIKTQDGEVPKITKFILATYQMVVTELNRNAIGFSEQGDAIELRDLDILGNVVLPKYFRHNHVASFTRQLNNYDFETKVSRKGVAQTFAHPNFQRAREDLLHLLRRRSTTKTKPFRNKVLGYPDQDPITQLKHSEQTKCKQIRELEEFNVQVLRQNELLRQENANLRSILDNLSIHGIPRDNQIYYGQIDETLGQYPGHGVGQAGFVQQHAGASEILNAQIETAVAGKAQKKIRFDNVASNQQYGPIQHNQHGLAYSRSVVPDAESAELIQTNEPGPFWGPLVQSPQLPIKRLGPASSSAGLDNNDEYRPGPYDEGLGSHCSAPMNAGLFSPAMDVQHARRGGYEGINRLSNVTKNAY